MAQGVALELGVELMARKKARKRSGGPKAANGKKFGPTVKRWGLFRGPGKYVRTQTGIAATEKLVPAALGLVALAAITPALGGAIAQSMAKVPVAGPVAASLAGYGAMLRSRVR